MGMAPHARDDGRMTGPELRFPMKAFTLWQPWASLAVLGFKGSEFRGYELPAWMRGKRCAIHAAARPWRREAEALLAVLQKPRGDFGLTLDVERSLEFLRDALEDRIDVPRSAVIGTVVFADCVHASRMDFMKGADPEFVREVAEHGNYGWRIDDPHPLTPIVPSAGQRGFWDWDGPDGRSQ